MASVPVCRPRGLFSRGRNRSREATLSIPDYPSFGWCHFAGCQTVDSGRP